MELGNKITLPGVMGMDDINCELYPPAASRTVKIYCVPRELSSDGCFIAITDAGQTEIVPPSRGKDTTLLVKFSQNEEGLVTSSWIHDIFNGGA